MDEITIAKWVNRGNNTNTVNANKNPHQMSEQSQNSIPQNPADELSFDITITNGAAKMLQKVMSELGEESAKEVIGMGVQILNFALTEGELVVKKPNGEEVRIVLKKKL